VFRHEVSKGSSEAEFARLTGAEPSGYGLQIQALENLAQSNVNVHPAVMVSFSTQENIKTLRRRLKEIAEDFEDFEMKELVLYGKVEERLLKAGLGGNTAPNPYTPYPVPVP